MPKTRAQKIEAVVKLKEKLDKATALVFADYQQAGGSDSKGLNMSQLSDLRNKLQEVNAEFSITKNSLLKRAFPSLPDSSLEGPTATLFAYDDQITPIKLLVKAFKDTGIGKVKLGFLGTDLLDEAKIIQLSSLPSKDELRGEIVGVLVAPLSGLVSVLNGNLRNLVYVIDGITKSKGGE